MYAKSDQGHIGSGQPETGQPHKKSHTGRKKTSDEDGQHRCYIVLDGKDTGAIGAHDEKGHLSE